MNDLADILLTLTVRLRKAGVSAFIPLGLSWREAVFLLYIERGYVRPTDLAKEVGALLPTISGLGAKFAASGLIEKVARQSNAREVTYVLTEKGRDMCQQLRRAWEESLPVEAAELTKFESDRWLRLLLEVPKPMGE